MMKANRRIEIWFDFHCTLGDGFLGASEVEERTAEFCCHFAHHLKKITKEMYWSKHSLSLRHFFANKNYVNYSLGDRAF